jgi:hypothetical protein
MLGQVSGSCQRALAVCQIGKMLLIATLSSVSYKDIATLPQETQPGIFVSSGREMLSK